MSNYDRNWESKEKLILYSAFRNWHHTACTPKTNN
jgi:hypothetical protein